jgi:hypothetical protein
MVVAGEVVVGREAHTMQVGGEKWGGRLKFIWELWGKKKKKRKKKGPTRMKL